MIVLRSSVFWGGSEMARLRRLSVAQVKKIVKKGGSLADADLSELNLRGLNLMQVDLARANLEGADLGRADLTGPI